MVDIRILEDWDYPAVVVAQTPAQRRAAEAARIKAENEARKQRVTESKTVASTPAATPTPTPAPILTNTQEALARLQPMSTPTPAPTPALTRTEEAVFGMTNTQVTQASNLAQVVAQAVVQAPVVVSAPEDVAPRLSEVRKVAEQVASSVAPIIAPELPPKAVNDIIVSVSKNVVSSPEVKATPENVVVTPQVSQKIAETVAAEITPKIETALTATEQMLLGAGLPVPPSARTTPAPAPTPAPVQGTGFADIDAELSFLQNIIDNVPSLASGKITEITPTSPTPTPTPAPVQGTGFADIDAELSFLQNIIDNVPSLAAGKITEITPTSPATTGKGVEGGAGEGEDTPPTQFVEYEYTKDFTKRRAKFFDSKTGKFTFGEWEDSPVTKEDFDAEQARIAEEEAKLNEKRDAFALVEATMRSYGFNEEELKEITDYIAGGLINPKLGPNQLLLQLRQLQSYKDRFAGNEARRAKGLNALSEAAYLQQERDYAQTLGLYGQNKFVSRQQFADLIGNDISNTELSQRVATAVNRLQNADPSVLKQLREYYPSISEQDIVSYFLSPDQTLPELEVKTTTAEIGATARQYGLDYGMGRATELQQYGVDLERARTGFGNIARVLPRTQDLAAFYQEAGIDYNQQIAEEEEFKGLASARRARERLKEIEIATFSGQAGTTRGALGRSTGGQI